MSLNMPVPMTRDWRFGLQILYFCLPDVFRVQEMSP